MSDPTTNERCTVIKPPTPLVLDATKKSVFLAGSIEMGRAEDWQTRLTSALADLDITILNPRRDAWDASWKQSIDNPQFREQVDWELDAQERADLILFYFAPTTQAPITLLELGLFASTGKLIVCCPDGYWRKGNVEIVCARHRILMVADLDELARAARPRLVHFVPWPKDKPKQHNANNEPCDMWTGPCSCGAWHKDGR